MTEPNTNVSGHEPSPVLASMQAAAEKFRMRVIAVNVGGLAYTVMARDTPGVVVLNSRDTDLFERLDAQGGFDDAHAAGSWIGHFHALSSDGIALRQKGWTAEAYQRQRLALFIAVRLGNASATIATVTNIWMIREELRDVFTRAAGPPRDHWETQEGRQELKGLEWATSTIAHDARIICPSLKRLTDEVLRDEGSTSVAKLESLHAVHRVSRMASDAQLRRATLKRLVSETSEGGGNEFLLLSALDELAQLDAAGALVAAGIVSSEADIDGASSSWLMYKTHRDVLSKVDNVQRFVAPVLYAFRQLNFLRTKVTTVGTGFGHQLSYAISGLLQYVGRDLVALLWQAGDHVGAISVAESVQSRAMSDWMGRTHGIWRVPRWFFTALPPLEGSLNGGDAAEFDDIVAAAKELGTPVVYYMHVRDRHVAWVVLKDGSLTPIALGDISPILSRVHECLPFIPYGHRDGVRDLDAPQPLTSRSELDNALRDLHEAIVPHQLQTILDSAGERVVIILDSALNTVPFAALRTEDGRYLIEKHELVFLPCVTAWFVIQAAIGVPAWKRAKVDQPVPPVVIANTVFESEYEMRSRSMGLDRWGVAPFLAAERLGIDPRHFISAVNAYAPEYAMSDDNSVERIRVGSLPAAFGEAVTVAELLGVKPQLDADATVSAVLNGSGAQVMHLATHGLLSEDRPRASCLVLSDGLLMADHLYQFDPGVRVGLVVLSACRTGLGGAHLDSVIGLANAFMIAGAQTVVSTLWRIPDEVTAGMMKIFYRELLAGSTIAAALRLSQLETLANPETSHPYYWAAFRMIGHPANPFSSLQTPGGGDRASAT